METKVLDHGYIKLIESWGSDERIIESARMSTGKGFLGWGPIKRECGSHSIGDCPRCNNTGFETGPGDEKLLRTLYTKNHTTPFEMCGATFEVQAPIFVFREWHRHRTMSYNEFSARYSELPDLFYVPSVERLMASKQSLINKQSSEGGLDDLYAIEVQKDIKETCIEIRKIYKGFLNNNVSKEIARLIIPVNQYSKMRVSANLLNWIRFLRLRLPENAQWEIRQYANVIRTELESLFPRTMDLFTQEANNGK